ncbi:hypothetical protein [Pedobacter borealis]|uniref:hypothetical protein n=1 Tax=Pedobacter borealis TaxID=475254 RepID=UPI000493B50E|nr:hypothetical protein [Pedobacter borealis]
MKKFLVLICVFLVALNFAVTAQQSVEAEIIVVKPAYEYEKSPFYFHHTSLGNWIKGVITDSTFIPQNEIKTVTHNGSQGGSSVTSYPNYELINLEHSTHWSVSPQESYSIATKHSDSTELADSSAFYRFAYVDKFKDISGYKCQKVVATNKLTNRQDSMYVCKALNSFKFRANSKFRKADFIMQFFYRYGEKVQAFTVVSLKKDVVPLSSFSFPKNCLFFNRRKDLEKWYEDQAKLRTEAKEGLDLPDIRQKK